MGSKNLISNEYLFISFNTNIVTPPRGIIHNRSLCHQLHHGATIYQLFDQCSCARLALRRRIIHSA